MKANIKSRERRASIQAELIECELKKRVTHCSPEYAWAKYALSDDSDNVVKMFSNLDEVGGFLHRRLKVGRLIPQPDKSHQRLATTRESMVDEVIDGKVMARRIDPVTGETLYQLVQVH